MSLDIRATLADVIGAAYPGWLVAKAETTTDVTDRPALLISQRTIGPLPEAPATMFTVGLNLTLVSSYDGSDNAEDELDGNVIDLWETLMSTMNVNPTAATKAVYSNNRLAYDVSVDAIVSKD